MRDIGIEHIKARPGQQAYGMGLGVMLLDDVYPGFPGDVRNASGYPFPIQYEIISGVDIKKLVVDDNKIMCLPPIIKAAQKLQKLGCRAIIAECGYFAYFQREVAASVKVPVFMSSLLQVAVSPASSRQGSCGWDIDGKLAVFNRPSFRIGRDTDWIELRGRRRNGRRALPGVRPSLDLGPAQRSPGRRLRQSRNRVPVCGN